MNQDQPEKPPEPKNDWREVVAAWQRLSPEEQLRRRLARIPEHVASSMAFEGEPVDVEMLKRQLVELLRREASEAHGKKEEK